MKGKKTPTAIKEKVILCRASGMSWSEIAKECEMAETTAFCIMEKYLSDENNAKEFEELKERKKREYKAQAEEDFNRTMKKTLETLFTKSAERVNKALDDGSITTKEALTALGISFDKRQIVTGGATQNVNLKFEDLLEKINEGNEY